MGRFPRTVPSPIVPGKGYDRFRSFVRQDFEQCCAYCYLHEFWCGGEKNYEIDHFRPKSSFPELAEEFTNLYWSCHICNAIHKRAKWPSQTLQDRGYTFVDLCTDRFEDHYTVSQDGRLHAITTAAEYTIEALYLNNPFLMAMRSYLLQQRQPTDKPPID